MGAGVGHDVRPGPVRRRNADRAVGARPCRRRRGQSRAREPALPAGHRAPGGADRACRPGRGTGRRGPGGARGARPDSAGRAGVVGAAHPSRGIARQPDEGHRARHLQADERGHHGGPRRPGVPGRRGLGAEPGPRDRRRQVAATVVASRTRRPPCACSRHATRRTSARTGTPMSPVASWAGRSRTSSRSRSASRSALGLGDNTKATLITRGLAEMARLGEAMGADPRTFAGLAGMGDLVATCSSPLSRNRRFGEYLGQGLTTAEALAARGRPPRASRPTRQCSNSPASTVRRCPSPK